MFAIIVHGGAGAALPAQPESTLLNGVRQAACAGLEILTSRGNSLDAVTMAVMALEDNPVFNAGTGSALNIDGEAEMDAGVMVGSGLNTGNVTCLRNVRHPVQVARSVMEETDHVCLAADGALRFARACGHPDYDPVTPERVANWQEQRQALERGEERGGPRLRELLASYPGLTQGTVGAVALDPQGDVAAATSTGGTALKLSGRVGDSPSPGAGNYATPYAGVSATGRGELMMRFVTAKTVTDKITQGWTAQAAVKEVLTQMGNSVGQEVGIIAIDREGRPGIGHLTPTMPYAFACQGQSTVVAEIRNQG